jgi:hypothetical protein
MSELMSTNSMFDTPEGRSTLEKAALVFIAAAFELEDATDPNKFLAIGGVLRSPDRLYAEAFLEMVNYNRRAENVTAMVSSGERSAAIRLSGEYLDQIVKTLKEIKTNARKAAANHAPQWRAASYGRVFKIADFSLGAAVLKPDDLRIVLGGDAAFAYVLQVLATAPLCDQLRWCELESCGRFFLFDQDGRGAPPRYCVDSDHAKQALRIQTRKRVSDYRKALKKQRGKRK